MDIVSDYLPFVAYGFPLVLIFIVYAQKRSQLEKLSAHTHAESKEAGMMQPPSLHPVVDTTKCIGCESCVHACPEFPAHQVLGIVNNKAELVSPTDCIGHGACMKVCPVDAISLVFGTTERGIDIPAVNENFSTNVPGIYIAGELGGMGLIRNAIEQGKQAITSIYEDLEQEASDSKASCSPSSEELHDVVIVGAGPAGMAATLGAMQSGLKHVTIEQNALGGTVAQFPRGKLVMTAPADLPLVGLVNFTETRKEELVGFWKKVELDTGMEIRCDERLIGVNKEVGGVLSIKTDKAELRTRSLLLAIGRRGTPRTLGVPGEELPKVTYSLIDPTQYTGKSVVVVGGGDSALEAACSLAEEPDTTVTLIYRSDAFSRAKKKNRERVQQNEGDGQLQVLLRASPTAIKEGTIMVEQDGKLLELENDVVIVCAGGILPNSLLEEIGIGMETKYGTV